MFAYSLITILLLKIAEAQINGEFWWLNENVAKLQQVEPPPPKFDDVNEFETDESIKVLFKDNELYSNEEVNDSSTDVEILLNKDKVMMPNVIYFQDQSELGKPDSFISNVINKRKKTKSTKQENNNDIVPLRKEETNFSNKNHSQHDEDEFRFVFPTTDYVLWEDRIKNFTNNKNSNISRSNFNKTNANKIGINPNTVVLNDKIWFKDENKQTETESICTFIGRDECLNKNGIVHMPGSSCPKKNNLDVQRICCILPLASRMLSKNEGSHIFHKYIKRYKRSDPGEKLRTVLKQRNALLLRNQSQPQKMELVATTARNKPAHKIVTPDYVDPYWNIKNSKFRDPTTPNSANQDHRNNKYDYSIPDEVDYTVELPQPGLVGLYSENERMQGHTSWKVKNINKAFTYGGIDEVSEEDDGDTEVPFGYSTFDPRLGERSSTNKPKQLKRRPHRVTTPRNELQTSESQAINFHSTPDFHVLQGFKLLNLAGNKNRLIRKTTTERFNQESIEQTSPTNFNDDEYVDIIDLDQQVFKSCGRNIKHSFKKIIADRAVTESGCDPWLAIVVSTKNPESILCYATIVHPRAAVTAADCVHGKSTGEVTLITGVWDLKSDRENSQQRMTTNHVHPLFNRGDLANNLALLHWKRPLRVDAKVQPACLGDPHVGDSCYFVGWGGYDRALQPRPHWQHATILTPRNCGDKISSPDTNIPAGAFCASVKTRGTVTGIGGPLLCKNGDRVSIVGVAVYRENVVVLLPIFEWIITVLRDLHIQ